MFLSVYERTVWASARLDWLDEETDGAVEVFATRPDGSTLAIEHTLIQPHPREKQDSAFFERAFPRTITDPSLLVAGEHLHFQVPIGALKAGENWADVAQSVFACIRENRDSVPVGLSTLTCPLANGSLTLQVERTPLGDAPGMTHIRRYGTFDVDATVRTALERKLPKLVATQADKRLFLLERDQFTLSHGIIIGALQKLRSEFPGLASVNEVWIAETHEGRNIVLFEPLQVGRPYSPVYTFAERRLLSRLDGEEES